MDNDVAAGPKSHPKDRVRKRSSYACNHCRRLKMRCSGSQPCERCERRNQSCQYDRRQQKILVSKGFLSDLEEQAASSKRPPYTPTGSSHETQHYRGSSTPIVTQTNVPGRQAVTDAQSPSIIDAASALNVRLGSELASEIGSEPDSDPTNPFLHQGKRFTNPLLVESHTDHTSDESGKLFYLGTSSNWSFGTRILAMIHTKAFRSPLPTADLHFEGSAYQIGWNGYRGISECVQPVLPTIDFALYLINAVKFHCGQLFHLFDEGTFMRKFYSFHETQNSLNGSDPLWYVHYLFVLALGKGFIVRASTDKRPPGEEFYIHAMRLLPDVTVMCQDPLESMELLCCAGLYLQCADKRAAAYNLVGQAMRLAVYEGIHTDIRSEHYSEVKLQRCREIWWTVYILDCHMSSLNGSPLTLAEKDIRARLPSFSGSEQKSNALGIHVKLAKTIALVLQTVYSEDGRVGDRFLSKIKAALKNLADVNDERTARFSIELDAPSSIGRLPAYLHLFHHQCIVLTTRPLLYKFWQNRLESSKPIRISASGGVRTLVKICVASASQALRILESLQAQSLLESFLPFDLEVTWSSALVLFMTRAVDPSLLVEADTHMMPAYKILDEITARGNLIAEHRRSELRQLEMTLKHLESQEANEGRLDAASAAPPGYGSPAWHAIGQADTSQSQQDIDQLLGWDLGVELSGEQLETIANALSFEDMEWLTQAPS
ncbi:hypothetical protein K431DRAFT_349272 [Polychaeton citri CBS 116435]|uniref:Zn(2)-C6 fungal-type domain-containing protein n=1 Tax=Polychaeton citri CBS 116435 TaxID=1314669 RepID=A0A9P4UJC3_9PEZI|nr:hypothetical protein K431DRAFT_349272 [Polychaeton citri CBS 116435]